MILGTAQKEYRSLKFMWCPCFVSGHYFVLWVFMFSRRRVWR
jgi:hypothetical protein